MSNSENEKPGQTEAFSEGADEYLHSLSIVTETHKVRAKADVAIGKMALTGTLTPVPAAPGAETAVIVCHGMGQQVPFETLNQVASALLLADREHTRREAKPPAVTLVKDGDAYLPRADVTVGLSNKNVHLYEVYWAPITEGQVNSLDVLKFLMEGGGHGLLASAHGHFKRFLYGQWRELEIKPLTVVYLLMAVVVVASLVLHYLSFSVFVGAHCLPLLGFHPFGQETTRRVTAECAWVLVGIVSVIASFLLWRAIRLACPSGPAWDKPCCLRMALLYIEFAVTLLIIVVSMGLASSALLLDWPLTPDMAGIVRRCLRTVSWFGNAAFPKEFVLLCVAGWSFVLLTINAFIIEYVGDVAAYISAHELNKFWNVREQIQQVALSVSRFVYQQGYKEIIFVGHSLGSVVAYDALNAVIREASYIPDEYSTSLPSTKALITFGSPLDKTAFLFREHMPENGLGVREALAMAIQPVIAEFPNWPKRWINIYSPADIISGSLEFYQLPPSTPSPSNARTVENRIDFEAHTPLLAHNEYWGNRCLREALYAECV